MSNTNPYTSTQYEDAWSQGYSYGYYYPADANPSAPAAYAEHATVYLEGVLEGQQDGTAAAAAAGDGGYTGDGGGAGYSGVGVTPSSSEPVADPTGAGDGGYTGNAGGAGYSGVGVTPSSSEAVTDPAGGEYTGNAGGAGYSGVGVAPSSSEAVSNPEVTVYGDPNRAVDPNSEDDAYGDGYMAGYYGTGFDDSNYADAVKPRYGVGWSEGAAAKKLEGDGEHHSAGEEIASEAVPHLIGEAIGHALHVGFGGAALGAILGGPDTKLLEAPVYQVLCHRSDHGLNGDPVLDAGAWHGTPTYDYNAANSEGHDHATNWNHTDNAVYIWYFKDDTWDFMH